MTRYFVGRDITGGYDYLVKVEKRDQWFEWIRLNDESPVPLPAPSFSVRLNSRLVFENPTDDNGNPIVTPDG